MLLPPRRAAPTSQRSGVPPDGPAPAGDITIIEYKYRFEPVELAVPAGVDLTLVVENRDDKTSHNIHFPTLDGSPRTKLENGRGYQTVNVRFDKPGRYPFVCDIHTTMRGTAVAAVGCAESSRGSWNAASPGLRGAAGACDRCYLQRREWDSNPR